MNKKRLRHFCDGNTHVALCGKVVMITSHTKDKVNCIKCLEILNKYENPV